MVLTQYFQMYLQRPHPTFKWDTPCNCWALWDRAMPVWLAHNPRQVPRGLYLRRGMCIVLTEAHVHWQVCTSVWLVALANSIDPLFLRFNGFQKYQTWSDDIPVAIEIKSSLMQILLGFCFYRRIQQFYTEGIRQPRFQEKSTWQIPKFEVTTTRGLAWTRFSRSLGKKYLQEVKIFF